jgi:hypothetical protein
MIYPPIFQYSNTAVPAIQTNIAFSMSFDIAWIVFAPLWICRTTGFSDPDIKSGGFDE